MVCFDNRELIILNDLDNSEKLILESIETLQGKCRIIIISW